MDVAKRATEKAPPARRAIVAAALLALGAGWLAYQQGGQPSAASAMFVAVPVEPMPGHDRAELDRQTTTVLEAWPAVLDDTGDMRTGLAIRANLFEAARTQQLAGPPDPAALDALTQVRVQSIIAVGDELRCTIDGKLCRVGATMVSGGIMFSVIDVTPQHVEVETDTARFRIPMRR